MAGYYNGSLIYIDLTQELHKTRTCRERAMMAVETFWKKADEVSNMLIDNNGIEYKMPVPLAAVCTIPYINDASYMPSDTTLNSESLNNRTKSEAWFIKDGSLLSP